MQHVRRVAIGRSIQDVVAVLELAVLNVCLNGWYTRYYVSVAPMKLKLLFDFEIKTLLHFTCLFSFFLFQIKSKAAMDVKSCYRFYSQSLTSITKLWRELVHT